MISQRGQGTIEYLVIIAIVVVIALVVVGLLLQVMGNFGGTSEQSARLAWQSASPLAITDWTRSVDNVSVVVKNLSSDPITLSTVCMASASDCNSTAVTIPSMATSTRTLAMTSTRACTAGNKYAIAKSGIVLTFNTASITGRQEAGVADIVGTC